MLSCGLVADICFGLVKLFLQLSKHGGFRSTCRNCDFILFYSYRLSHSPLKSNSSLLPWTIFLSHFPLVSECSRTHRFIWTICSLPCYILHSQPLSQSVLQAIKLRQHLQSKSYILCHSFFKNWVSRVPSKGLGAHRTIQAVLCRHAERPQFDGTQDSTHEKLTKQAPDWPLRM